MGVFNKKAITATVAGLASAVLIAPVSAENLTWFGETSFSGAYPKLQATDSLLDSREWLSLHSSQQADQILAKQFATDRFGAFQSMGSLPLDGAIRSSDLVTSSANGVRSEFGFSLGRESILFPVEFRQGRNGEGLDQEQNALGIKWRHRFGESNHLTVGAQYGRASYGGYDNSDPRSSASTLATVTWTSAWGQDSSAVTGSVFFGDEKAQAGSAGALTRQVYGMAVGGKWAISESHTPFVSYRYQTGYGAEAPLSGNLFEYDNATYLSAGWNWQVSSNWSMKAEADFAYQRPTLDLLNTNGTRLFFTTRYDFR